KVRERVVDAPSLAHRGRLFYGFARRFFAGPHTAGATLVPRILIKLKACRFPSPHLRPRSAFGAASRTHIAPGALRERLPFGISPVSMPPRWPLSGRWLLRGRD